MILYTIGNKFVYELVNIIHFFYPFEKVVDFDILNDKEDKKTIFANRTLTENGANLELSANIDGTKYNNSSTISADTKNFENECERILSKMLFEILVKHTGYRPAWGILTGVRPAKLFRRFENEFGAYEAREIFENDYLASRQKTRLCERIAKSEDEIIALSKPNSFSLYISIPFCPSRCSYCSFVSHSVEKSRELVPKYVEYLIEEIKDTASYAKSLNLRLETVYIGGGTPTTLEADDIAKIMKTIDNNFDLKACREYTVEAGRPDTITKEKLEAIAKGGATRISINPQTLSDKVLKEIGRNHTARQTIDAFALARKEGFTNINMDLIAGLPLDTITGFEDTLRKIISLAPESVTVHTLAMKRSSKLTTEGEHEHIKNSESVAQMLEIAQNELTANELSPYYMYRQSKTVGNLENVGYAKPGFEGLYNIYIMDETHTILACGAGAVTKLRRQGKNTIERIFNYKYPYEYIRDFSEILNRKKRIGDFYA